MFEADAKTGLDTRTAANALLALDDSLRFFLGKQPGQGLSTDYRINLHLTDRPWTAWVEGVSIAGQLTDAKAPLHTALRKALLALLHLLRLVQHTRLSADWDTREVLWGQDRHEIGILNSMGEPVFMPLEMFCWYSAEAGRMVGRWAPLLSQGHRMTLAVWSNAQKQEVCLTADDLREDLVAIPRAGSDLLFPELAHGDQVRLEGRLTRGNASSNSIGLAYGGHVLNCVPERGHIALFKEALFLRCVVEGSISRLGPNKSRAVQEKRPTIVVKRIEPLETKIQLSLFGSTSRD